MVVLVYLNSTLCYIDIPGNIPLNTDTICHANPIKIIPHDISTVVELSYPQKTIALS